MAGKLSTIDHDLFVLRCVQCGYDGMLLEERGLEHCPSCGCSLIDRPARSYAEMEGLTGEPITMDSWWFTDRPRIKQRWLAFLVIVAICAVMFAVLASATVDAI